MHGVQLGQYQYSLELQGGTYDNMYLLYTWVNDVNIVRPSLNERPVGNKELHTYPLAKVKKKTKEELGKFLRWEWGSGKWESPKNNATLTNGKNKMTWGEELRAREHGPFNPGNEGKDTTIEWPVSADRLANKI